MSTELHLSPARAAASDGRASGAVPRGLTTWWPRSTTIEGNAEFAAGDPAARRTVPDHRPGRDVAGVHQRSLCDAYSRSSSRIDMLVNNAGITKDGLALRMKKDDWDLVLAPI